jgi:hypothetical protein
MSSAPVNSASALKEEPRHGSGPEHPGGARSSSGRVVEAVPCSIRHRRRGTAGRITPLRPRAQGVEGPTPGALTDVDARPSR